MKIGCRCKNPRSVPTTLWALGLVAMTAVLLSPPNANAQSCSAGINPSATPNPVVLTGTTTVTIQVSVADIQQGNTLQIPDIQYEKDCDAPGSIGCTDDSNVTSYSGDGTILSNCMYEDLGDANGDEDGACEVAENCTAVVWLSNDNDGGFLPNQLTFTPTTDGTTQRDLELAPNSSCTISFDVTIEDFSSDVSPLSVQMAAGYDGGCDNGENGDAAASFSVSLDVDCEVTLEKDVSCDQEDPKEFSEDCISWNAFDGMPAENVTVRYRTTNTGDEGTSLQDCVLTDSNKEIIASSLDTTDTSIEGEDESDDQVTEACSDLLAEDEPDTGMVLCDCYVGNTFIEQVSDNDDAEFDCQTPGLEITKACEDPDGETGEHPIDIVVTNTGDATLVDCEVTDEIFLDDPECPADQGEGTSEDITFEAGESTGTLAVLLPGQTLVFSGSAGPLENPACNTATVTCTIDGTEKEINSDDDAVCTPRGDGCLTRTPGFWGTHPHVTELYLPLESCGLIVDGTDANLAVSATEDMCMSGVDAKANSTSTPQLQLIRQCMAANLNVAATLALEGDCAGEVNNLGDRIAECCNDEGSICNSGKTAQEIGDSGCIEFLDAFNNLPDTLDASGPFVNPGPANPEECQEANGNGFVNPGRNLGFKECKGNKCP